MKFRVIMALAAVACAGAVQAADVVDTAAATGQARTLVEAAQATGLSKSLRAKGPYTLFVPTDAAWAQLPPQTVEQLLSDQRLLTEVLKFHIIPGKLRESDLQAGPIETAQGQTVAMARTPEGLSLGGARVVQADVEADNGVVYLIDRVIFPSAPDPAAQ